MKIALVGVGQAGGKISERLITYLDEVNQNCIAGAIAVNTAKADLMGLDHIPEENRVLVGQAEVKGHGVGADNELGARVVEDDIQEVMTSLDSIPTHEIDAFLVVSALGGGTGSGGAPVIAKELRHRYTAPVYGFGVLPSTDEGSIYTLNAARSFKTFVDEVDNLLLFDNDSWKQSGESVEGGYETINQEIVERLGMLLSAGEIASESDAVGESVVDASEIINTLKGGGITTIGYSSDKVKSQSENTGLLSRFKNDDSLDEDSSATINRISSLTRKAALGRLTLECEIDSTERALVIVGGPPKYLSRKGIEKSRKWIEEQTNCMEVRGGDYPQPNASHVTSLTVFSGVTNIPRIKELQQVAIEAQDTKQEIEQSSEDKLDELVSTSEEEDEDDELESLF